MNIPILDLSPQYSRLKNEIDSAIARVIQSGAFIMGPEVELFENEVAKYLGAPYAVALNSGTDALVIALRTLGVGKGDEVITTTFSFFATGEAISSVGATPVFIDIEPDTFLSAPQDFARAIRKSTKAIIPVHLFGETCEMDELMSLARERGIFVIEDCAQSFGAKYKNKFLGTYGELGAFSFFPSKNLGAFGDGGMITTNDANIAELARKLRTHGSLQKYKNEMIGYNSRLDTLQAAILRAKLPHINTWNEERRQIARWYHEQLEDCVDICLPRITPNHVFHQYTIRIRSKKYSRDQIQARLQKMGIGTMIYYPIPMHQLPVYRGQFAALPEAERAAQEVLSLPMGIGMTRTQVESVASAIKEIFHI